MRIPRSHTFPALRLLALTIFLSTATAHAVFAQQATATVAIAPAASVQTVKLNSKMLGIEVDYNVVLPPGYAAATATRYPVLYLLHGLTGHYADWASKSKLPTYAARHRLIIVTPEGNNGWYTDSPVKASEKYESYIMQELIPDVEKRFRASTAREGRAVAGLSMGGYGAMKFGLKHPDKFIFAASMSGALGAASWPEAMLRTEPVKSSIVQAFGPADDPAHAANDIFKIVAGLTPERVAALPFLYVDCGTEDFLIGMNRDFAEALMKQKVPHEYRQLPGKHDWPYWDRQIQAVLPLVTEKTSRPAAATTSSAAGR